MAIVKGSTYKKGGITFARTTSGKLVRVDKPTRRVGIAVATTGKKRKGKAAQKLTAEQTAKAAGDKKTIAIAVGKEDGKTVVKDVEPYVGKSGVKQLSRLTDVYGRLGTGNFNTEETDTEVRRSVDVYVSEATPTVPAEQATVRPVSPTPQEPSLSQDPIFAPTREGPATYKDVFGREKEIRQEQFQTTNLTTPQVDTSGFFQVQPTPGEIQPTNISKITLAKEAGKKALQFDSKLTFSELKLLPLAAGSAAVSFGKGVVQSFNPLNWGDAVGGFVTSGAKIVSGTSTPTKELQAAQTGFETALYTKPFETAGGTFSALAVPGLIKAAKKTYVKTGSEFVPPEIAFSEQVTSGKTQLPKTGSTAETIKLFEKTRTEEGFVIGQTSAPQKLSGTQAGVGKKASTGFEDPGIYVTPGGEGSPYFLGIKGEGSLSYSFNPLSPLKDVFKLPTVTEFRAKAAKVLPKKVTDAPGFSEVKKFQETQGGSGDIYVTKRSQLGQGELKKQFNPETGKMEAGTSELEAVVPLGQEFAYTPTTKKGIKGVISRVKGFEKYTEFKGELVPIRTTELVTSSTKKSPITTVVKGEKILSEQEYSSSYTGSKTTSASFSVPQPTTIIYSPSSQAISTISSTGKPSSANINYRPTTKISSLSPSTSEYLKTLSTTIVKPSSSSSSGKSRRSSVSRTSKPSSSLSMTSSTISTSSRKVIPMRSVSRPETSRGSSSLSIGKSYYRPTPTDYTRRVPTSKPFYQKQRKQSNGFFVEIREKGLFRRAGKSFSDVRSAFGGGKSIVGGKAAASFRIRESRTGRIISDLNIEDSTIRKSKKEEGVFIERRGKRIKSGGELKEITFKGVRASKRKRL